MPPTTKLRLAPSGDHHLSSISKKEYRGLQDFTQSQCVHNTIIVDTISTVCLSYRRPLFTEAILRCGLAIMLPMWAAKCRQNKQEAATLSSLPFVFGGGGGGGGRTSSRVDSDDVMPSKIV